MSLFASLGNIQSSIVDGQKDFNGKAFPLCLQPSSELTMPEFVEWIIANKFVIDDLLREYKAILFRNFPVTNPQELTQCIEATELKGMDYIGGAAVRTQITSRVFTANESPASEKIPFHHEMAQVPLPPTHLFFYCEIPPAIGGETPILPSAEICRRMEEIHPTFMKKIEDLGVQYIRIIPEHDDPLSAIGRGWRSTYLASTREEAEKQLTALGSTWEWMEDGSGNLKTITAVLPAIRWDTGDRRTNERTFFNSMVAAYTGWNDSRNVGEKAILHGDGEYCDPVAMQDAIRIMDEIAVAIPWQTRDFILVDNRTGVCCAGAN